MMKIKSTRVWIANQFIPAVIEMNGGKITDICTDMRIAVDCDYGDLRIVPGFIDIHTHGAYLFDTNSADEEGLKMWKRRLPEEGVTSFLPTTVTDYEDVLIKALKNVAKVKKQKDLPGAEILGVHLEGPFIDEKHHGAQPLQAIAKPDVAQFIKYQEAAEGNIRDITMAVEKDDHFALTEYCASHGVAVSVGHSSATAEQVYLASAHGACCATHTFNGMSGLVHRDNGVAGAVMRTDDIYAEIIGDCNHVTDDVINLFFRTKGKHRAIMVSDSLGVKGGKPGQIYHFDKFDIEIYPDGSAHLVKEKKFAGSTLKLNDGLRNLVDRAMVPFDAALNACTINPADMLKVSDRKGRICTGYDADIVVLNDDYSVAQTYCMGKKQLNLEAQ